MTAQVRDIMTGTLRQIGMRVVTFVGVPKVTDYRYNLGTVGRNNATGDFYILRENTMNAADWQIFASATLDFYENVLSIADASLAPPTEVVGARYILDASGPVHADWDGAVSQDIVEFDGATWIATTPSAGGFVYVDDITILYVFTGGVWEPITAAIPDATTSVKGIQRNATGAETTAYAADNLTVAPSTLSTAFASPPPFGVTTPNTAKATYLDLVGGAAPAHLAGRVYYNNVTDTLDFYNSESEIALNIGEENWIKVRNETGGAVTNGEIVYLNGTSSNFPLIELAIASSDTTAHVIGVVTHDIEINSSGYITTFGLVRGLNTAAFTGGDIIYLSPTVAGTATIVKPDNSDHIVRIGYIGTAAAAPDGSFFVTIENYGDVQDIHGYTNNPNGFLDPTTDVQVSFVNGTRTLTIAPQATSYSYWSEGVRYDKTSPEDIIIPDTEGSHYIYYDGSTLSQTMTFSDDLITKYAFVAGIYWDATNNVQLYLGEEFRHTTKMGSLTHEYLHETRGFTLQAGGGLTDILVDQTGALDSHAEFGNEATIAWDEDAEFSHTSRASTDNISFYYKEGVDASNIWRADETASFGVITTGTGRAAWNELTGGSWQQTEVTNLRFILAHVFTYNDSTRRYGVIQGENEYMTLNDARDGAQVEIGSIILDGLPTSEWKFLGTIIYQTSDGYGNTVQSRIRSTDTGDDYIDLRDESISRGGVSGTLTDHGALTGLADDDHTQYFLTDQSRALDAPLTVANGGVGVGTLTDHGVLVGSGVGAVTIIPEGATGKVFTGNTGADPSWEDPAASTDIGNYMSVPGGFVSNLGITYSGSVLSITSADGTALSAENPGYVMMQDKTSPGQLRKYTIIADQGFIDSTGASNIADNLFGMTENIEYAQDVPFFPYAVGNNAQTEIAFMISRVPGLSISPVAAEIGAPDDAVADEQYSFFSFDNIDEADYNDNPCLMLGSVRMRMNNTNDWAMRPLLISDGIGRFQEGQKFTFPTGARGAATGTFLLDFGGTAPVFSSNKFEYTITPEGQVSCAVSMSGDGGTDGAGAVSMNMAIPLGFEFPTSSTQAGFTGTFEITNVTDTVVIGQPYAVSSVRDAAQMRAVIPGTSVGAVQNGDFGNGSRSIQGTLIYYAQRAF